MQFIKNPQLLNLEDQKEYISKSNDIQQLRDARHIEWWLNHNDSNQNNFYDRKESLETLMLQHDFDEAKYLQSLDLKSIRLKVFSNLKKAFKTMKEIEKVLANQEKLKHQTIELININDKFNVKDDSIQRLKKQIDQIPYTFQENTVQEDEFQIEFNIELIDDTHFTQSYIDNFDKHFCMFVEHLDQICNFISHK